MYAFLKFSGLLEDITQDRLPATLASQQLASQAERLVAAAPTLLTATSAAQQETTSEALFEDLERVQALLDSLTERAVDPSSLVLLANLVERLSENLGTLDTMIVNNLVLIERRKDLVSQLRFTDIATRRLLAPGLLDLDAKIADLRQAIAPAAPTVVDPDQIAELARALTGLEPHHALESEISTLNDRLIQASTAESLAALDGFETPFRRSLSRLYGLLQTVDASLRSQLVPRFEDYQAYASATEGIAAARKSELRHRALMEVLLDQNVEISQQLTAAVEDLVARSNRDIRSANLEAAELQRSSTIVIVAVVLLSLLCSLLIVWLYVGNNLIARLTSLGNSMLAIAGGNLSAEIPRAGSDEIGQMTAALTVFRDTAVEVRNTNLREIREARRRLVDAIESISEGFSLFDSEDRLVLCNSRYQKELYPEIADIMVPGTPFETIIRAAVDRGLIVGAREQAEVWVEKRLEKHRNPTGAHLQQQSDGRWIQINERRTEDGGTVAVYADITDVKDHEQDLESLSNQLSKYLSPQVYDSIFSGKQDVTLTSSRKKLTVFFSDIAGFTEAADRLESEELTQLLNQYLTEMSQIALEHGATVDKYMGDGILIFFGAPESRGVREDALACAQMAIAMRRRMHDLTDHWRDSGVERPLRVRMGIHTGFCTVGNFGSEDRLDYTIIGRGVNTAARLEAAAHPGEILLSYETFALVRGQIQCEEEGEIEVRGAAYPVTTYRVVDSYENLQAASRHFSERHPKVMVDLDLDAMTADERQQASTILRDALLALDGDEPREEPSLASVPKKRA